MFDENDLQNYATVGQHYLKTPELKIKLNDIEVIALLDTGSQLEAVSQQWYQDNKEQLGQVESLPVSNTVIKTAIGTKSKLIRKQLLLRVDIDGFVDDIVFMVIPGLSKPCILGINALRAYRSIMDFAKNQITLNLYRPEGELNQQKTIEILTMEVGQRTTTNDFENAVSELDNINATEKRELVKILSENSAVFQEKPGRMAGFEYQIRVSDPTPFYQKSYPVPLALREAVDAEIQRMLDCNVIEKSNSQYVNPLVTVIKRDKSVRLCLDARRINLVMSPDYEGFAQVTEILASCSGTKVMSTIDLKNSFWQVPLHRESRPYTGFMHRGKTYQFTVMPFGLKNSSASLARALDLLLSEEVKKFTLIYVDDCLVISKSIKEHLIHLKLLFEDFRAANITVNFQKSQLFRTEINYLGFTISTTGITTDKEKISAIMNFPRPRNHKQLKSFLGLTNYYNRFSSKYADTTQPLLQLLKKDRKFKWTTELEQQFHNVKHLFVESVVLQYPDCNKQYYLQTDASKYALGGHLFQYDDDNNIAAIAFTSRTFKGAESNYHTTEKELLSIIHCLNKFRMYLIGTRFTILTDNKALTFLNKCHLSSARMTRWVLSIQEFDFDIQHCNGRENIIADALSRSPEDLDDNTNQQEDLEVNTLTLNISKNSIRQIKNISIHQRDDEKLNTIIRRLSYQQSTEYNNKYLINDKILYRKEKHRWKVYIPAKIRESLIKDIHETYGHGGVKRTLRIFKESFATDQLIKATKDVIRRCDRCQKCKDNNQILHGETSAITPKHKGELISADYYGPLVTSSSGVRYILVLVDNFTKFVKLYALRRATTYITLRKIKEYIEQHGAPKAILTDNGSQFVTSAWTEGLSTMEIQARYTAIRNPCTNVAERINRQLGNLFRIVMKGSHSGWAHQLKIIEACINESHHDTIGMTPYQAHFGEPPPRSWTRYIDHSIITEQEGVSDTELHLRIKEKREKEADKINSRTKITNFEIGEKVLLKNNPKSDAINKIIEKFCDLYIGPFMIKERIGNATYILGHVDDPEKIRGRFNIRQLKKYHE